MKDKRGFELAWSTIVIMILAFALLLIIIFFLTTSSGSFFDKIKGYFSYSNVDSVVEGCNFLGSSGASYSFCCEKKIVKYYENGNKKQGEFSCSELADMGFVNNKINKLSCAATSCMVG